MLTILILAKNEAQNLKILLPTLKWADSVVVINDESSDNTITIAEKYGARVITHPLLDDFSAQRNFALSLVKSGWALFLDADERLTPAGIKEIQRIVAHSQSHSIGYALKREDIFYGKALRFGETQSLWLTRLAPFNAGFFKGKVHETWSIPQIIRLSEPILHHSHDSLFQLFSVVSLYARLRAQELFDEKKYWNLFEQLFFPLGKFFQTFIFKGGFLDGWRGLAMSLAMTKHSFLVRWYLLKLPWIKRSFGDVILRYLLIITWLLLPLGQLNRFELPIGGAFYGFEVGMLLAISWFLLTIKNFNFLKTYSLWIKTLIIFSLVLLLSWILSPIRSTDLLPFLYLCRWFLYVGFLLVSLQAQKQTKLMVSIHGLIQYCGYVLVLFGWLQFIFIPDTRFLFQFGWDDHYYRMIGVLFDPNFFGLLALLFACWTFDNESTRLKWLTLSLCGFGIIASYSRTAYVLSGLWLVYILIIRLKSWKLFLSAIVFGFIVYLVLPKPGGEGVNLMRSYSIASRLETSKNAWEIFKNHPFLGIGYNYYPIIANGTNISKIPYHPSAPDSSWVFILATSGIIGFSFFCYLLFCWWKNFDPGFIKMSLFLILLHSITNNSFFYPWVLLWWWLLLLQANELITEKNEVLYR